MLKFLRYGLIGVGVLLVLVQLVPIERSNPVVTQEVQWNSPETRALAQRACYDCHSNETAWPWYSYVAPISFFVADHVEEGRQHLNFSEWDQRNEGSREILEVIREGEMPLSSYLVLHSEARLSPNEQQALLDGLAATLQRDPPVGR